jgi:DNA-binding GntR family transcriptional regulator
MQLLKNSAPDEAGTGTAQPAHQSVYEVLRARILFGDIPPGQQVTIQGLVTDLGAGMTPVREAIRRLTSEGALEMLGNRRICVPDLTASALEELEFVRQSIEPELARRATLKATDALVSDLEVQDSALNTAIEQGDITSYLMHNYQFHTLFYSAADAPILAATVDRIWLRFGPSLRVVCGRYGTLNLPDKHADLLFALRKGDADAAARAMTEDIAQGLAQIREALPKTEAGT